MYIASITSDMEDKVIDWLDGLLSMFGKILSMIYGLLKTNPTTGSYKDAWNAAKSLNDTFMIIGVTLLTIFFLWGFCRDSIDIRQEMTMESVIKLFIRYIISVNLMSLFTEYVPKLCGWAISIVGVIDPSATFKSKKIAESIVDESGAIMGFVILIIMFLLVFACGGIMIYTCMGRFFNLYLLLPFGCIALSTFAGGGQISQTGVAYVKNLLAVIFEIVAMAIALAIIGPFLQGHIFKSGSTSGVFFSLLEVIVKMVTITACFKGAGATVRKAMNM